MPLSVSEYENTLFYGDCLRVLSEELPPDSVDLIYLDPPFNSKRNYNMNMGGKAQTTVFRDTWKWSNEQREAQAYIAAQDVTLREALDSLIDFVTVAVGKKAGLRAYLVYMAARLLACRIVLKETGSIYLHCDPTAGHYLKLLMDVVFGAGNFRNEIVWHYSGWNKKLKSKFESRHDLVYFYSSGDESIFNSASRPWASVEEYVKNRKQKVRVDEKGKEYVLSDAGGGKRVRRYLDDAMKYGVPLDTVWEIDKVNNSSQERRGWDTQKPLALLKRIILASSNEGDLVLDPFCGCGTAVKAAHILDRRWIGIDVEPLAVDEMANRMREECGIDPNIRGIPYNFEQAERLAKTAPFEFERWALRLVPGAQPNLRQVGDGGLDGRSYVDVEDEKGKQPLYGFQVKGGANVGRPALDAFSGALQKNKCVAGLFIVLREDTANKLRSNLATQDQVTLGGWTGGQIGVWSVEDWFNRGEVCLAPVPPLVGASETLGLLKSRDWQPGLNMPQR